MRAITDLPSLIKDLSPQQQHLFQRIFDVSADTGRLTVPEDMQGWVEDTFGEVDDVEEQRIVRIANRLTDEAALFNGLRANRPIDAEESVDVDDLIEEHSDGPFSTPKTGTPEDVFGRVENKYAVSASNIAKYDARHGLIIADDVDPLSFDQADLRGRFALADDWFDAASDEKHRYPFLMWNCLWKSGASIVHSHMQLLLAKSRPYRRIDRLNRSAKIYKESFERDLYDDIHRAHDTVGLSLDLDGVDAYAHLTPRKEKEVVITADDRGEAMADAVHTVLRTFIDDLGVQSFNVGVYYPPRSDEEWHLPVVARIVDRGSLESKTTDMGGMEVYGGENVVASDPYAVKRAVNDE